MRLLASHVRLRPLVLGVLFILFITVPNRVWSQGSPGVSLRTVSLDFPDRAQTKTAVSVFVYVRSLDKVNIVSAYVSPPNVTLLAEGTLRQLEPGKTYAFPPKNVVWPKPGILPMVRMTFARTHSGKYPKIAFLAVAFRALSNSEQQGLNPRFSCNPNRHTQYCDIGYTLNSHGIVQIIVKRSADHDDARRLIPNLTDDGAREQGDQRERWELRDDSGAPVQPGLYFSNLLVRFGDRNENQDTNDESVSP